MFAFDSKKALDYDVFENSSYRIVMCARSKQGSGDAL